MLLTAFSMLIVSITAYGEEYKALVIGIGRYDDNTLNLKNPVYDAEDVAEVLEERYRFHNVVLLSDKDYPTLDKIN
ncbi:MAG: caspase family protein, partial [Desulfobacteraceae bacterium]|nr:caspase family protein [Desulfobacteraceae bacterium]